jgi:cell wall-associated NlpC family hydrolase
MTGKLTFSGQGEANGRAAIVAEALTWNGTPYHPEGRIKGVGVDCGTYLAEVYERAGIIPHMDIAPYRIDEHLHSTEEKYLAYILSEAHEIEPGTQKPGDIAMWKFGQRRSHGAIIIDWPHVIHATFRSRRVVRCNVAQDVRFGTDNVTFYSYW